MQPSDLLLPDQGPDPLLVLREEQVSLAPQVLALDVEHVPGLMDCRALAYCLGQPTFAGEELEEDRLLRHLLGQLAWIRLVSDRAGCLPVLFQLPLQKLDLAIGPRLVLELRVCSWRVGLDGLLLTAVPAYSCSGTARWVI